jgi:riboflavin synthase
MFTGLVEDVGTALRADRSPSGDAVTIEVRPERIPLAELVVGESVSHDGVCLTVTEVTARGYTVLAGAETLARTTLGRVQAGDRVNLERALRAGDRLGGHLVQGHVDGTGAVVHREDLGGNLVLAIAPPPALLRYVIEKGSICVDGVSLTVNRVTADDFWVALIPHTRDATTLGVHPIGHRVNLEVDLIAKYVEKLVTGYRGGTP